MIFMGIPDRRALTSEHYKWVNFPSLLKREIVYHLMHNRWFRAILEDAKCGSQIHISATEGVFLKLKDTPIFNWLEKQSPIIN